MRQALTSRRGNSDAAATVRNQFINSTNDQLTFPRHRPCNKYSGRERERGIDSVREDYRVTEKKKEREGERQRDSIYKEKSLNCNDEQYHDRDRGGRETDKDN